MSDVIIKSQNKQAARGKVRKKSPRSGHTSVHYLAADATRHSRITLREGSGVLKKRPRPTTVREAIMEEWDRHLPALKHLADN